MGDSRESEGAVRQEGDRLTGPSLPRSAADPGFEKAWSQFQEAYEAEMLRTARGLLRRCRPPGVAEQEAADVVQAYLLGCLQKGWLCQGERPIRNFRAFLRDQLRKFVWSHLRKEGALKRGGSLRRRAEGLDGLPAPREEPAAHSPSLLASALQRAIELLGRRSPAQKQVVLDLLRTADGGRTSPGLASLLGSSAGNLAVLKHRARRKLAALLVEELGNLARDEQVLAEELGRLGRHAPWIQEAA